MRDAGDAGSAHFLAWERGPPGLFRCSSRADFSQLPAGATTPAPNYGRLCAQAGTPGELVGVSRWILRCGLVHMKAGSILFDLSNHKIHSRILRYAFSYLNGYKDTYPKI